MKVARITPGVGAEISGVDLTNLRNGDFASIVEAFDAHSALLFRDQRLSETDLLAFSRRFGDLDEVPVNEQGRTSVPGFPEVYVVSNITGADGQPIGSLGAGEAAWHTDMSYLPVPPYASILYAIEVPPTGGDTWICGMTAAFETLPDELRQQVAGRRLKHDGTYNSGGYLRAGASPSNNPTDSIGTAHPILCRHPRTERPTLYLGRRRNAYIEGLPLPESEALLDALWAHAVQPAHVLAHRWRVGDLLMWDNRATMHRRDAFDPAARRRLHRTQIKGTAAPCGL